MPVDGLLALKGLPERHANAYAEAYVKNYLRDPRALDVSPAPVRPNSSRSSPPKSTQAEERAAVRPATARPVLQAVAANRPPSLRPSSAPRVVHPRQPYDDGLRSTSRSGSRVRQLHEQRAARSGATGAAASALPAEQHGPRVRPSSAVRASGPRNVREPYESITSRLRLRDVVQASRESDEAQRQSMRLLGEVARARKEERRQVGQQIRAAARSHGAEQGDGVEQAQACAASLHESGVSMLQMVSALLPTSLDGLEARLRTIESLLEPTHEPLPSLESHALVTTQHELAFDPMAGADGAGEPVDDEQLDVAFGLIDRNDDGRLSRAEIIKALQREPSVCELLRLPARIRQEDGTRDAFERVYQELDLNADKEISRSEFRTVMRAVLVTRRRSANEGLLEGAGEAEGEPTRLLTSVTPAGQAQADSTVE